MGLFLIPLPHYAQEDKIEEEESAEVFLEEYSDAFQEKFFEALKQKGIENYDKAINLLLECKQFEGNNSAVDYELAKAYLVTKNYILAQEYALLSLASRPEDYWVLNTTLTIMGQLGMGLEDIKQQLPIKNTELRKNLVRIYYKQQNYEAATNILNGMQKSDFSRELTSKIEDSVRRMQVVSAKKLPETDKKNIAESPLENYLKLISELMVNDNFREVETQSLEAMENFPTQPYFYYSYGLALIEGGKYKEALTILELGLDFILDDEGLANKMYKELANAHTALGNSSKANMYLSKIKPGL
ncbi:hypothetical protein [Arenibacter sp. H213]|uniref:Tetratricopeptide repeat protein n=1 Tax=Arenibacter antarcticus TaxID=2040469 RepID=A0ABW5VDF6_9FLAO|nr:hypothetical protein [Arenibacter sp. H213]